MKAQETDSAATASSRASAPQFTREEECLGETLHRRQLQAPIPARTEQRLAPHPLVHTQKGGEREEAEEEWKEGRGQTPVLEDGRGPGSTETTTSLACKAKQLNAPPHLILRTGANWAEQRPQHAFRRGGTTKPRPRPPPHLFLRMGVRRGSRSLMGGVMRVMPITATIALSAPRMEPSTSAGGGALGARGEFPAEPP